MGQVRSRGSRPNPSPRDAAGRVLWGNKGLGGGGVWGGRAPPTRHGYAGRCWRSFGSVAKRLNQSPETGRASFMGYAGRCWRSFGSVAKRLNQSPETGRASFIGLLWLRIRRRAP